MKKMLFLVSIFSVFLLTSCFNIINSDKEDDEVYDPNHIHTYTEHYYYDDDNHYRNCIYDLCDSVEFEHHDLVEKISKEATHFEDGVKVTSCTKCDYKISTKYSIKHSLEYHERVEPTCHSYGYEGYYECSECYTKFKTINASNEDKFSSLDDIKIKKLPHGETITYIYYPAKTNNLGRIYIKCGCGMTLGDFGTKAYNINETDSIAYDRIEEIKCLTRPTLKIILKKDYIAGLVDELFTNPPEYLGGNIRSDIRDIVMNKFEEDGLFINPIYFEEYSYLNHTYGIEMLKNPSNAEDGLYKIYCTMCNETIKNVNGEDSSKIVDGAKLFTISEKLIPTCEKDGYTKYDFDINKLLYDIRDNYTIISDVNITTINYFDTSKINVGSYTITSNKIGHDYCANIINPDVNNNGSLEINCNNCNDSYSNTATTKVSIGLVYNYFDYSTTTTCEASGIGTYKYNDKFYNNVADSFDISIDDAKKYIEGKLCDISISEAAYGHNFNNYKIEIIKYPNLEEEGIMRFPCDKEECGYNREIDGNNELVIPVITDTQYYSHNDTSTCTMKGIITASLDKSFLTDKIPNSWKEKTNYISSSIMNKLSNFTYEGSIKNHRYEGSIWDEQQIRLDCIYSDCVNQTYFVTLPKAPNSIYRVYYNYAGDCKTEGYTQYKLNSDNFIKFLSEYEGLQDICEYIFVEKVTSNYICKVINGKNYNNHIGTFSYDPIYGIEFPTYSPGTETFGSYHCKCSACYQHEKFMFEFSKGEWIYNTDYASRVYQLHGSTLTDPRKFTKFKYTIDYGEGELEFAKPTETIIEYGSDVSYVCSGDDFYLSGTGYGRYIEVYIDNILYKKHAVFYTDEILNEFHVFIDCDPKRGYVNIHLKIIY